MKKKILQKSFLTTLLLFCFYFQSFCQTAPCSFDEGLEYEIVETPDFQYLYEQGEAEMLEMMNSSPQAIMNNVVYYIPVVFHIIHLEDEEVGSGSNISEAQVLQALNDLNSDFRDLTMEGTDVQIEFCLAQRDPYGNMYENENGENITGIQREVGTGTGNFENVGMTRFVNGNEVDVKALSIWPNTDYLNIWVVHRINGDPIGFATFPASDANRDGVVLEASATGTQNLSNAIAHEVGHFFSLYHTFQGSSNYNDCPDNTNCHEMGDMLCDTRPHPYLGQGNNWFPCDEDEYKECDASEYMYNVFENHMNYADNDCRIQFTPDQAMWMRCALMTLRSPLLNSLGCLPPCDDVVVDFDASATTIDIDDTVTFTADSDEATDYFWEIEHKTYTTPIVMHKFENAGRFNVCLTVTAGSCSNRLCTTINVYGKDPCFSEVTECDLVLNSNFLETNFTYEEKYYGSLMESTTNRICNWLIKNKSPDVFMKDGIVAVNIVGSDVTKEAFVSNVPTTLKAGQEYLIDIEFAVTSTLLTLEECHFEFGLAESNDEYIDHTIDQVIGTFSPNHLLDYDWFDIIYLDFNIAESDFEHAKLCITPEEDMTGHIYFINTSESLAPIFVGEASQVLIRNVDITCKSTCVPVPDFTFDEECPNTFIASNTGDGEIYEWEFKCDGFIATGPTITRDFPAGTDCEVCLTVSCDFESQSVEVCKTVIIPEDLPEECMSDCTGIDILANTCQQTGGLVNEYITNFTVTVPAGSGPCGDLPLQSNSTSVGVKLDSYKETPNGLSEYIDITIGMTISVPPTIDLIANKVGVGLTLCDKDDNIICYNISVSGSECESCLPLDISSDAICMDTNPVDGIYNYTGNITFNMDPQFSEYKLCDGISSQVSFEIDDFEDVNGNIGIDYTIDAGSTNFDINTILCIEGSNGVEHCIPVTINIPDPCPEPPTKCDQEWVEKTVNGGCEIVDGQIKYTFAMSGVDLDDGTLQLCHGDGIWATIEGGGSAIVNNGNILDSKISFSIDIFMPCDFDQDQYSYELSVIVCNDKGEMECLLFPLIFPDCDEDCRGDKRSSTSITTNDILIYPNPASQFLTISSNKDENKLQYITIYDQIGRSILSQSLIGQVTKIDISGLMSGIHFVKITGDNQEVVKFKKLVIVKSQ